MNAWRWLGLSMFLLATVCFIGTSKYAPEAFGQGADDKKIEVKAAPDKGTIEPGKAQAVALTLTRGKSADKEVTLTADVDPKDKGVTAKIDAKVDGKAKEAKLTVESTSAATEGDYKISIKVKSTDSPDASATVVVTVKKAAVVTPAVPVVPVAGGHKLPFKAFEVKDKVFYTVQKTETVQEMTVMNQKVIQKQEQEFLIKWTPKAADKNNWVVEQEIKGVKLKIDIGGNKIDYDSSIKNPKNPMTDFFEQLQKSKLTFYIDKDKLKVDKVEGREDFIKGLSDINPQMRSLLNAILSDKALKNMAEPAWSAYPDSGSFAKDQTWERKSVLELGPIGTYKTDFTFKVTSADAKKAAIDITTNLTYTAPTDKQGLPFVIKSAKLEVVNAEGWNKGSAEFDGENGRFKETSLKMKLKGDLEIEVGNQTTTVNLTQTQTATSSTKSEEPTGWAPAK